jgi:hypothetical protein
MLWMEVRFDLPWFSTRMDISAYFPSLPAIDDWHIRHVAGLSRNISEMLTAEQNLSGEFRYGR